jgi:hypothetical protein
MKKVIKVAEIKKFAKEHNAAEFERYCNDNNIPVIWLDVCLTNLNEDYYNVDLPDHGLSVTYYDGELEEIMEVDFENI